MFLTELGNNFFKRPWTADQAVEMPIGELPEMTTLLKLLKLDQKIEGMGLDLSRATGNKFNWL